MSSYASPQPHNENNAIEHEGGGEDVDMSWEDISFASFSDADTDTASDTESESEAGDDPEERAAALAAAAEMKQQMSWYLHPEAPVARGLQARCFYDRGSARIMWLSEDASSGGLLGVVDAQELQDEGEERAEALAAVAEMKEAMRPYMHPEVPVAGNGAQARCFFERASAPPQETRAEVAEREEALAAVAAMKASVRGFLHPEDPVAGNGAQARCFFERASAPPQETVAEVAEREEALAAVASMKASVRGFLHPEDPVPNGLQARCFFDRASAPHPDMISTRRTRGESNIDMFEMEGDEPLESVYEAAFTSLEHSIEEAPKDGELSRSPSSVALFDGVIA